MDHSIPHPEFFKAPLEIFKYQGMPYQQLGRSGLWGLAGRAGHLEVTACPQTGDQSRVDEPAALALLDQALALAWW